MDKTNSRKKHDSSAAHAPLRGVKVVELARILAGPWAGQTLADLGADVIKVESAQGDDTRSWGPPFITRTNERNESEESAAYYHGANRGKSSVICDFSRADDLARLKKLIAQADVVIENFKTGSLHKFGLDYASLSATNEQLVYLSITGFGHTGPRCHEPGYDFLIQGMCGIMDLTGEPQGEPQKVGVAWIDIFTGLYGVIAVQAALHERAISGKGQHIDLALFDVGVAVLANQAMNYIGSGKVPVRLGNAHPNIVPYQLFPVQDGHIIIACGNDRQFSALCDVLKLENIAVNPAFSTNPARVENRTRLIEMLVARTTHWHKTELIVALKQVGVPSGPVNNVAEALHDEQIIARDLAIELDGIKSLRTPIDFSRSTLKLETGAPRLGDGAWRFRREDKNEQNND